MSEELKAMIREAYIAGAMEMDTYGYLSEGDADEAADAYVTKLTKLI